MTAVKVCIVGKRSSRIQRLLAAALPGNLSLEFEQIFVDGNQSTAAKLFAAQIKYYRNTHNLLTPGEYGCAMSHISSLSLISASGCNGLIFEDDAYARVPEKITLIKDLLAWMGCDDVVILGAQDGLWTEQYLDESNLLSILPGSTIYRTAAYAIGHRAAKSIKAFQEENMFRADDWRIFAQHSLCRLYYINIFGHPSAPGFAMEADRAQVRSVSVASARPSIRRRTLNKVRNLFLVNTIDDLRLRTKTVNGWQLSDVTCLRV